MEHKMTKDEMLDEAYLNYTKAHIEFLHTKERYEKGLVPDLLFTASKMNDEVAFDEYKELYEEVILHKN